MLKKIILSNLYLLLILLFAFILRFIFIGEIPPGPAFDEIQVIINAQSLANTNQPIPGTVTGIFGQALGNYKSGIFSELGSYLIVPWMYLFGFNWPLIKIPFIFTSLGMVLFVYLITQKLINKNCALIAAFLFAINPWSVHLGRTAYESLFSYLFYLIAVFGFISWTGWKILFTLPFLILGFLSYFGSKPQLLPLSFIGLIFNFIFHRKARGRKWYFSYLIIAVFILTFFILYTVIILQHPAGNRLEETGSGLNYSKIIDDKRRISIPTPFISLAENKLLEEFRERIFLSIGALSPQFLFLKGHSWGAETLIISDHGPMYILDFFLIILGLIFLARRYIKALLVCLSLILIALVPNAVSISMQNYFLRDGLLFPVLVILAAGGFWSFFTFNLQRVFKIGLISLISIVYFLSFIIFIVLDFYRTPIDNNEGWNLQNMVLTRYLTLAAAVNPQQNFIVVVKDINGVSSIYLLFSGNYDTKEEILTVNESLANFNYKFDRIKFLTDCPTQKEDNTTFIIDYRINCPAISGNNQSQIASPKDAGGKYMIFDDKLCGQKKNRYPLVKNIKDLAVKDLTASGLCEKWITDPVSILSNLEYGNRYLTRE